ncbi:hypothetical protein Zmor_010069 [Zophobas morio]|uniref:DUF3421 domain-containing protein n=1 Tax=Zophobas morio TaxID=2755281 RepID=A0AA38INQ6_9CUCU|nr:hypothetical protein Zmor_010069 [Zophobas morio]
MSQKPLYRWVDSCITDPKFPDSVLQVGADPHGHAVYVGKAPGGDYVLPITVIPADKKASIGVKGVENPVQKYKLLSSNQLKWVPSQNGVVLPGAVQVGHNKDGIPIYAARVFHERSWIVGAINPKYEVCYFPYNGKELTTKQYEALVSEFYVE